MDLKKFKAEDVFSIILMRVEGIDKMVWELKGYFSQIKQMVVSQFALIKKLETQVVQIST